MDSLHSHSLRLTCLGLIFVIACSTRIAEAGDAPPANAEVTRLVTQLGDLDSTVRRSAALHLREIGSPALPALRAAAESDDPEVQKAARAALKTIGVPLPAEGNGPYTTKVQPTDDEHFSTDFSDGKRVVRIEGECRKEGETSPHHIKMTFTGLVDGKATTHTFTADDEDDLHWNSPQAWKFYHTIFNHDRDMAAVRVYHEALDKGVKAEMVRLKSPAADRKEFQARLKRLDEASARALAAIMYDRENAPGKMAEQYRESDSMRKYLKEKNLPIAEGEMDPPPEARLGMYFLTDPRDLPVNIHWGLMVKVVAAGERAARIGVRPGDIIQRIDGVDIESARQLRPACLAKPAGMTIEVYRYGETVVLHEKSGGGAATKP